jgi:hypothetical protein
MQAIGAVSIVYVVAMALTLAGWFEPQAAPRPAPSSPRAPEQGQGPLRGVMTGQEIFRFDTFGDEQLWTDVLQMHQVVQNLPPATALALGLKIDVEALPDEIIAALRAGDVDLTNPAITVELIRLNAVVGVKGTVQNGQLTSLGITCALCHSSVDDSFAPSIGRRTDGWANIDLNVGAIVAESPALGAELKAEFRQWGPGKYDPRHHAFDGKALRILNSPSLPIVIPPVYGLRNVGFETFTGDGPISYWNAYVGIGQMGGKGDFRDDRIGLTIDQPEDLVTPKLPALLDYQLKLRAPVPPRNSLDERAVARGRRLFRTEAGCATCHQSTTYTDVLASPRSTQPFLHAPAETGMDPRYAQRTATRMYRTTPLRGLLQHPPYFHDGSARTLVDVVNHYDKVLKLGLSAAQKADLVEFLKSL